jgi:hypothetical protein
MSQRKRKKVYPRIEREPSGLESMNLPATMYLLVGDCFAIHYADSVVGSVYYVVVESDMHFVKARPAIMAGDDYKADDNALPVLFRQNVVRGSAVLVSRYFKPEKLTKADKHAKQAIVTVKAKRREVRPCVYSAASYRQASEAPCDTCRYADHVCPADAAFPHEEDVKPKCAYSAA